MELGTILGVGQDAQSTIYLADEVTSPYADRVFVSDGDTLYRKRVRGSGSSGGPVDEDFAFSYEVAPSALRTLLIQRRGGVVTAMALGPGDNRGFIGTPAATDEMLTVLDANAISGMKVRNLPGEVVLEYLADVEDGNVIVVTRPRDDWSYSDFRLFYGTLDQMLERKVLNVYRGNDTDIIFLVGSSQFDVHFSIVYDVSDAGVSVHSGPATLDTGNGNILDVTERHLDADGGELTPSSLPGFSFTCIR